MISKQKQAKDSSISTHSAKVNKKSHPTKHYPSKFANKLRTTMFPAMFPAIVTVNSKISHALITKSLADDVKAVSLVYNETG